MIAIENVRLFDETEEKNRQLQQANENESQFVSSMSHELRTLLNAIIGLTEMMVTNTRFGTEKAQEPLQRVNRAGTHLLGLSSIRCSLLLGRSPDWRHSITGDDPSRPARGRGYPAAAPPSSGSTSRSPQG
jgi:hypothetical protein